MTAILKKEFQKLTQHAGQAIDPRARDLRQTMEPGDAWAQGDMLVRRLAELPPSAEPIEPKAQLVPGVTQGSRHCLSSLEGVTMFSAYRGGLLGPIFRVDRDVTITHPEHGHLLLGPGVYAIEYQRDLAGRIED